MHSACMPANTSDAHHTQLSCCLSESSLDSSAGPFTAQAKSKNYQLKTQTMQSMYVTIAKVHAGIEALPCLICLSRQHANEPSLALSCRSPSTSTTTLLQTFEHPSGQQATQKPTAALWPHPQPDVTKPCGKIECVHYLSRAICLHSLSDLPELLSCMALVTWANMAICLAALHYQRDIDMCTVSIKHLSVGYHIGFNARRALHARNPCQSYIQPACKLARRIATLRFRRTRRKPQTSVIGKLLQFAQHFISPQDDLDCLAIISAVIPFGMLTLTSLAQ